VTEARLAHAMADVGLTIAMGDSVVVAVTTRGVIHPLRRALRMGAVQAGEKPVTSAELKARVKGLEIRPAAAVKAEATQREVLGLQGITGAERSFRRPTSNRRSDPFERDERPPNGLDRLRAAAAPAASPSRRDNDAATEATPRRSIDGLGSAEADIVKARRGIVRDHSAALTDRADPDAAGQTLADKTPKAGVSPVRYLTEAQKAAVQRFVSTLEFGATEEAARIRREIEAQIEVQTAKRERADRPAAARAAFEELESDLSRPSIGRPGWKDAFKASLAGLPADTEVRIRRVETAVSGRKSVILLSGETVHLMVNRATGSAPTPAVAIAMIEHARARRWPSVVFSGGTPEWRLSAARLAARRGLMVTNPELRTILQDELRLVRIVSRWRAARNAVISEPDNTTTRGRFITMVRAPRDNPEWARIVALSIGKKRP
jgi:Large polyvalent protein-associated domain 7